jgi:acetoin utilization deacetylase AcuC-like enzyme
MGVRPPQPYPLLYYCDPYDIPLPEGHKFPMDKYRLLRRRLEAEGRFRFAPGPLIGREALLLAHDEGYVDSVLDNTISDEALRRIGFPRVPQLITRTLSSVGGTLAASLEALRNGWSGVLAGGTHHAYRDFGSGFCVFNDIAVAACHLLENGLARRIGVIDLDVHQGDGTAAIFAGNPQVFTLSLHGANNFPFRKQCSSLDVAFADGTGDEEYLAALGPALDRVASWAPDFVYYQCGVDALRTDRLGKLAMSREGLARRDRMVLGAVRGWGVAFVLTLGGGYSEPISETVEAAAQTYLLGGSFGYPPAAEGTWRSAGGEL